MIECVFSLSEAISRADSDQWGLHHAGFKSGGCCCLSNGPQEEGAIRKLAGSSLSGDRLASLCLYFSAHKVAEKHTMTFMHSGT